MGKSISIARTLIAKGYVENELFSNNWEISKTRLAKGQAGMYLLGNWAVGQVLDVGASPDDIGFFHFLMIIAVLTMHRSIRTGSWVLANTVRIKSLLWLG